MQDRSKLAESVLEQLADAVICADRSGAIIRWNRASVALFGYSSDEALGRSLDLIVPEHLRARPGAASTPPYQRATRSFKAALL
jgi:PAS domain S-box-containing protein